MHIKPSELKNPPKESEEFTVSCSTSGSCDYPKWLIHTAGQKQEWTSSSSTDMTTVTKEEEEGRNVTKLKLKVTWKDDKMTLSCRPGKSEDSWEIKNITLSVECECVHQVFMNTHCIFTVHCHCLSFIHSSCPLHLFFFSRCT